MRTFCVNITSSPLTGTLEDDNLRGEGRWERLMARGLLSIGERVGTPAPKWAGDCPNWIGHIEDLSQCIYLAIYGGPDQPAAGMLLLQFFSPPNERIENELRTLIGRVGRKNLALTHSYPSAQTYHRLAEDLKDRVAHLPMPVPEPTSGDPTQNRVLFFPARNIVETIAATPDLLPWIRQALRTHGELTFETVSACNDPSESLWEHPPFCRAFEDMRERVTVHRNLGHKEVQAIYARARLVVCPSGYGGPPLESARHGLPVIAGERDCSLFCAPYTPGFPELPRLRADGTLVEILDRLLRDPAYARRVGNACREYVAGHFCRAPFQRALFSILERAGL